MVAQAALIAIGVFSGLVLGLAIASIVFLCIRQVRRQSYLRETSTENRMTPRVPIRANGFGTSTDYSVPISDSTAPSSYPKYSAQNFTSLLAHPNKDLLSSGSGVLRYSYKDIQRATDNFTTLLGEGSFGRVYKALISTENVVAVKVLSSNSKQGEKEFQTEVSLLGRLHHRNLVNLLGYCIDKGQRMLIYEFMSNGSLEGLLYSEDKPVLTWDERLRIALDISHGIEYLHEGASPPVIHRDLKSANILLDSSMRAKVADFGLSREEIFDGHKSGVKGTYGYIDPTSMSTNKLTMKSDIYSFGVIVFELITAIHPHKNLMDYANLAAMSADGVDAILDGRIASECEMEEVRSLARIAHKCVRKSPKKRPPIGEVLQLISKLRVRGDTTLSFATVDLSRAVSRIEQQQVELRVIAAIAPSNNT